jgi:hypothetical protein
MTARQILIGSVGIDVIPSEASNLVFALRSFNYLNFTS